MTEIFEIIASLEQSVDLEDEVKEESDPAKLISDDAEDIENENNQGTKFETLEKSKFSFCNCCDYILI